MIGFIYSFNATEVKNFPSPLITKFITFIEMHTLLEVATIK